MGGIPNWVRRRMLSDDLLSRFTGTLEERVNRYLEVSHQDIIPNHHFAAASTECVLLYADGYFFSTVMVTQAVAEGIIRFVLKKNNLRRRGDVPRTAKYLAEQSVISHECADAVARIWKTRHDVHHMNPEVSKIESPKLALNNIRALAAIEGEIFDFTVGKDGGFIPTNPKYWDTRADGKIGVFLRLSP